MSTTSARFDHFPVDVEKHNISLTNIMHEWDSTPHGVLPGRPDVETLIRNLVALAGDDERIAIAACGPETLMWTVRRTATSCIKVKGPSIELHCEEFGWQHLVLHLLLCGFHWIVSRLSMCLLLAGHSARVARPYILRFQSCLHVYAHASSIAFVLRCRNANYR